MMTEEHYLHVGGFVAMGFDQLGNYLLTVSHSGRGVFFVGSWERVARDYAVLYPSQNQIEGIGPLVNLSIPVVQRDNLNDEIDLQSPCNRFRLVGNSEGIKVYKLAI